MKKKLKQFSEATKIRLQLLKIWFIKNISVFVKIAIVIIFVLIICGVVDESIPILGDITNEVNSIASAENWKIAIKSLAAIGSILFSIYMFVKKTKRIAIEDIKSKKFKIALINANLYFDEQGRLRKRPKTNKVDLEEENKVGFTNLENMPKENLLEGVVRASSELGLILTTDIKTNDEEKVLQEAQLNETDEKETETKPKKITEIKNKIFTKVKQRLDNLKLSLKELKTPKIEEDVKKENEEDVSKEEEIQTDNVEIVNVSQDDTTNNKETVVLEEEDTQTETKEEQTKEEPVIVESKKSPLSFSEEERLTNILNSSYNQQRKKRNTSKRIDDILKNLK